MVIIPVVGVVVMVVGVRLRRVVVAGKVLPERLSRLLCRTEVPLVLSLRRLEVRDLELEGAGLALDVLELLRGLALRVHLVTQVTAEALDLLAFVDQVPLDATSVHEITGLCGVPATVTAHDLIENVVRLVAPMATVEVETMLSVAEAGAQAPDNAAAAGLESIPSGGVARAVAGAGVVTVHGVVGDVVVRRHAVPSPTLGLRGYGASTLGPSGRGLTLGGGGGLALGSSGGLARWSRGGGKRGAVLGQSSHRVIFGGVERVGPLRHLLHVGRHIDILSSILLGQVGTEGFGLAADEVGRQVVLDVVGVFGLKMVLL
mmetsp:Transcript_7852/g.12421  ORF Transcript_7852/g.12421 Transcript_7852/m.12421 type:complete len:317 (+) Transcript_7852:44-994(+)